MYLRTKLISRRSQAKELAQVAEREESLKLKVQQSQEEIQRANRNAELAHSQYFEMKTKYGAPADASMRAVLTVLCA